ncbi:MAG: amidohydrolase family protein [Gemmatimonadaceae bacterium]
MRSPFWIGLLRHGCIGVALLSLGDVAREPTSITVREGTSMAVTVSPDGRMLAIDLQGSIWTLPARGGTAKRITDEYNDARQPMWSPDGKWIAFQGYRDGGYDIWLVAPEGNGLRQLTQGPFDDREPTWSHDGSRIAFSSDRSDAAPTRPIAGNYDIWTVDVASGDVRQITTDPGDDYMPSWSPDDQEIAYVAGRQREQDIRAVNVASRASRTVFAGDAGRGRLDAPSWGPGGKIVYHALGQGASRLELDGANLTGVENAFPFRVSWISATDFIYTSDAKIRRRTLGGTSSQAIEFSATLSVTPAEYARRRRDVDAVTPRPALGIVRPAISPSGDRVAFAALGDLYLMPVGGKPQNLTRDRFFDTDPAWSPDGGSLAWASDRGGDLPDIWMRDLRSGTERRLTNSESATLAPAWSPDGKRIAFLAVDGIWGRAHVAVVDVASGAITKVHEAIFAPGNPTWSADGSRIAFAALQPYSARFREGTNQILSFPATPQAAASGDAAASADTWITPVRHLSIDSRVGGGPAWSPDGKRLAVVYEGKLSLVDVDATGQPSGSPRRLTSDMAHAPSWTADSKRILYQSLDRLRLVDVESGAARDVPLELPYTPAIPSTRLVVHAGLLVDGVKMQAQRDVDIVVVGNRITRVVRHTPATHREGTVIDASQRTVIPGLIEYHTHLQKDFGEAGARAALAFGVTTVRSPGGSPYESVEYREAIDAGVRPGPRIFSTGYLLEWRRVYYNMAVAIANDAHLELELERAKVLRHDLIKSYVRMPDAQQKRIVEFAHSIGVPVSSHEVYPSALSGIDATEHTGGTSRRGYSPKQGPRQMSYADVAQIFSASRMPFTPTLSLSGTPLRQLLRIRPELAYDERFHLYPPWLRATLTSNTPAGPPGASPADASNSARMVVRLMTSGTTILAGTDTPNAANLHGELAMYVAAGMSPFQALQTATVHPARALGIDAGTVAPGRLADLVIIDGNPLVDITATTRVRHVIANGRSWDIDQLLRMP